jgi:hypothetical protein
MRRGLAAAAVSAGMALSFAPLFATSAAAQGGVTVTASPLTLSPAPSPDGSVGTNVLAVSGHFHVDGGFQPAFDWASVNLSWRGSAPGPQVPGPYTICGTPPSGPPGPACGGQDVTFNNRPLAPAPAYNGPYRVNATAKASDHLGPGGEDTKTTNNVDFSIIVPPPNVTGVTATVTKDRYVVLSWDRDATTPDVQAYYLWAKAPGAKDFGTHASSQTPQQGTGARISVTDYTAANKGGDYQYEVQTVRNGATGDGASSIGSDPSKSQSNKVTVPNPPPGATTVPTPQPSSGGAPPVVQGTPSGVNRNSGFSSSGSAPLATTETTEAVTPDPGFVRGLPYAGSKPGGDNSEGDNSAVAVTPGRHSDSGGKGYLVPVAGAAVFVLGALHLRIFKKRLDEPPSNLTPV